MLKGISPALSPKLLGVLCAMGHGDEIVLADANFPGAGLARRLLRADGHAMTTLLEGIVPLFPLDASEAPLLMMEVSAGEMLDDTVEADYMRVVREFQPYATAPVRLERMAFYDRARQAFAILMTGETRLYGNLILKKGVIG